MNALAPHPPPAGYMVRVRGHLDPYWSACFAGLALAHDANGTTLTGAVADQAELHGIPGRDLGVTPISVTPTEPDDAAS